MSPSSSLFGVAPGDLVISSTAFDDGDTDDTHATSEYEIWLSAGGNLGARVWSATVQDPAKLTQVALDDGQFEGTQTDLSEWTDFLVRVRHGDSSGSCEAWSEWSEPQLFRSDDGSAYLFDPDAIHTFEIDIPPDSMTAINAQARPPGCVPFERDSHRGTLRFEGQTFENVGLRSKGGCGSARNIDQKMAFKVNLSWDDPEEPGCPSDRRLRGLKKLTFNNMVQDRSFMHETLGYALYKRMGVPTPRTAHTRLIVNGELWGLYLHVESLDRRFAARWWDSNDGMLYEGTYWCDLIPGNIPPSNNCFSRKFGSGSCTSNPSDFELLSQLIMAIDALPAGQFYPSDFELLSQLIMAIDALPAGQFYPEVEQFFEFDTFLSSWAVDSMMDHWDGYQFDIINNYRVYYDPSTAKWTIVPTGIDQTFTDGDRNQDIFNVSGVLARRCLDEPECEAAFVARLRETITAFEEMNLDQRVTELRAQIGEHVAQGSRAGVEQGQWENQADNLIAWIQARPGVVRQILTDRGF